MNDSVQKLDDMAWAVYRMREWQRRFEQSGNVEHGKRMRAEEKVVDDLVNEYTMPVLPEVPPEDLT